MGILIGKYQHRGNAPKTVAEAAYNRSQCGELLAEALSPGVLPKTYPKGFVSGYSVPSRLYITQNLPKN